jgi:hypothetical protein
MRSKKLRGLRVAGLAAALVLPLLAVLPIQAANASNHPTGAVSTTDNPNFSGPDGYTNQACLNGQPGHTTPAVNCNIYNDKRDVWLSGLPVQAALGAGTYFFSVQVPGGQPDPNDAGAKNLSDTTCAPYTCPASNADGSAIPSGDLWTNREFTVDGSGNISYLGTHQFDPPITGNNEIQLFPYDDTTNPGGVYILAVCEVPSSPSSGDGAPGVNASNCKYDAFKVLETGSGPPKPCAPTISKDAAGTFDKEFVWSIAKGVTPSSVTKAAGTTQKLSYTVTASHDGGTVGNVKVEGTISVFNCNTNLDGSIAPMTIDSVTDTLSSSQACTVSDATESDNSTVVSATSGGTLIDAQSDFAYSCDLGSTLPGGPLDNTATVNWSEQTITFDNGDALLAAGSADFTFPKIKFTENALDNCATVTDTFNGGSDDTLGYVCVDPVSRSNLNGSLADFSAAHSYTTGTSGPGAWVFKYSRTVDVTLGCVTYRNIGSFVDNSTPTNGGSADASARVCGRSGALTMGFWQNKNGQGIIKNYCGGTSGTGLGAFLDGYNPFAAAPTTCGTVGSTSNANLVGYIYNIIKVANCSGPASAPCNKMLRAQDLATTLDVYFSDPALGGNRIGSFSGLAGSQPVIGSLKMDLTQVCNMLDASGGTATCSGTYQNASNVFGVASPGCKTVSYMLGYANADGTAFSNGNPVATSPAGATWYTNNKPKQVLAKNAFDAINNEAAIGC